MFLLCVSHVMPCQTAWLDGKHVVFGSVVEGYEVVKAIEKVGSESGDTKQAVMIADSGVVKA